MTDEPPNDDKLPKKKARSGSETWKGLYKQPVVAFFGALVVGFTAGIEAYRYFLNITNQETVIKNTWVLKSEVTGTLLRNEAVREIDHLIENGEKLNKDEETAKWLLQTLTFVQYINLDKNIVDEKGQKMSAVEANIRYAQTFQSIKVQVQKTLGVLKGFRSALSAQQDVR